MDNNTTLEDWSASGMNEQQGRQFAQDVHHIEALQLFIRSLPVWCRQHKSGVQISITCGDGWEGVGIEFGFDRKQLSVSAGNALIERLMETSKLMELENIIETMRGLGVEPEKINPLVDEANQLAQKLKSA